MTTPDPLSATFGALADPTRRAILARLALGEASVKELTEPFNISGPGISKHLKVLERAGLITRGREAQWRPCRLEPAPLRSVDAWLDEYRQLWEARLDRLGDYLRELAPPQKKRAPRKTRGRRS
jgi:DNA-binding transcriptional ArsR family regulator